MYNKVFFDQYRKRKFFFLKKLTICNSTLFMQIVVVHRKQLENLFLTSIIITNVFLNFPCLTEELLFVKFLQFFLRESLNPFRLILNPFFYELH